MLHLAVEADRPSFRNWRLVAPTGTGCQLSIGVAAWTALNPAVSSSVINAKISTHKLSQRVRTVADERGVMP
jgi:hypothetical protein